VKPPDSITISFLVFVLLLMPTLGVLSWFRVKSGKPLLPKNRRYRTMIALQLVLLALASLTARQNSLRLLDAHWPAAWVWAVAAAYLTFIAVRLHFGWRRLSEERKQRARLVLPENASQMRYWIAISLLVGLTEEYAYRGVAYTVLSQITGAPGLAVVVCVLSFGFAHMMQGWRGVLLASAMAVLFHITVFLTETLYVVIAFHTAYDLIVGVLAMRVLGRDVAVKPPEAQAAI
jgi:membrane protease YdiL (CAAX protease family)